jgi:hypothetical protein
MNISGNLSELPRWDDYYEPEKGASDDLETPDMAYTFVAEKVYAPSSRDTRAEKVLNTALLSRSIRALYEEAVHTPFNNIQSGPWLIKFTSNIPRRAQCCFYERTIHIKPNLSDTQALSSFVFELTNAISTHKFQAVWTKAEQGQIDCEEFVKEMVRIEFEGMITHHKVITAAISERNWSDELDRFKSTALLDFETFWSTHKFTPHADLYRNNWSLEIEKKAVSPKHPLRYIYCHLFALCSAAILMRYGSRHK